MAKADNFSVNPKEKFPNFFDWVTKLETFDMSDDECGGAVMEEAKDGFFRASSKPEPTAKKR